MRAAIAGAALVLMGGVAQAGPEQGEILFIANVGYATGKSVVTDDTIDGGSINLTLESFGFSAPISLGINGGVVVAEESYSTTDSAGVPLEATAEISSWPIQVTGRVWIGGSESSVLAFAGLGLGVHFSSLKTTFREASDTSTASESSTSFALAVPLGAAFFVSETVYLNLAYVFNFLEDSYLEDDMVHLINVGIGFRFQDEPGQPRGSQ